MFGVELGLNDCASVAKIVARSGVLEGGDEFWQHTLSALTQQNSAVIVRNHASSTLLAPGESIHPQVRSYVIVPLLNDHQCYGWLLGVNKRGPMADGSIPGNSLGHDEIGSMEASLLHTAAVMLATHAANARLFREKEELIDEAIHTLVGVIEAKDSYTCGHSDRVALFARRLAEQLGLTPTEAHEVYLSGLLHDIGKVGVADDVLLKPGALQPEEFAAIKRHPETGWRLLNRLKSLKKLLPGVLYHHEAMDGSGYPQGLMGEEIPQIAHILAVADAWDAMTSDRPYRQGMPRDKAEAILRGGAGTQWDEQVVEAFFEVADELQNISQNWRDHLSLILMPPWSADFTKLVDSPRIPPTKGDCVGFEELVQTSHGS